MSRLPLLILASSLAILGIMTVRQANACGGLFCSAANPVNQAAERIIFAQDANGTTTAVIEIQYEGPSENFSWVLPVPGVPVVELSSKQALDRLQAQTNPQYQVNLDFGNCDFPVSAPGAGAGFADAGVAEGDDGVHVLASGSVGPYDFLVLEIATEAPEPVQLMLDWLSMNDYDVSLLGEDLLGEYVAQGMNFLAVKLNKTSDAGSIRPVMITYQSERPLIPIRPTAVAANPDMGVMTWVLGAHRAIPANYRGLELNEALINWFNPNSNYNEVVIEAANEAGGHGFVTEHADLASTMSEVIWQPFLQDWRDELPTDDVMQLMELSASYFGSWDGFADVVRNTVPLRDGVTVDEFLECVTCYFYDGGVIPFDGGAPPPAADGSADPIYGMDTVAFLASLDELVVNPMKQTQALFDNADYTTRFYTTLSADEMTVDPEFDFNPDLPAVSNIHQVDQILMCSDSGNQTWTIVLESGVTVKGTDTFTWPITLESGLPFNQRILQYSTSGDPEVIVDNTGTIGDMVEQLPPLVPTNPNEDGGSMMGSAGNSPTGPGAPNPQDDGGVSATSDTSSTGSDCGCRVPGKSKSQHGAPLLGLGLALLALRRRRRLN